LIGEHVQEWRLSEIYGNRFLQRSVEDRVSRRINEIRYENRIEEPLLKAAIERALAASGS